MERLPWNKKKKDLQKKLLEGQYIKQWHQNSFDKRTEEAQFFFFFWDAGHFTFFFALLFYKIITKEENKQNKKVFTVHIFTLRHFCWGERRLI